MTAADLVFGVGDRIRCWGRFVVDDDGQWLDLSRVVPLSFSPHCPRPRNPRHSIPLVGSVDAGAVPTSSGPDGVVAEHCTFTGVWDGSALRVERQSPIRPLGFDPAVYSWTVPPCPEPPGGWPEGMTVDDLDEQTSGIGGLQSSGAAVTVVWFRPGPGQVVLVVAATDVEAVRDVLAPQLPGRLCVVASRWTRAQLDDVRDTLRDNMRRWTIDLMGEDIDDEAQASMMACPMRVGAELADWADSLPRGLLALYPALVPVRDFAG